MPCLPVALLMKASDQKIFDAIALGKDDKAIASLYDLSFRKIRDFIRKNSGSQEDAEDMFQDAILALFKMIKSGKYNTAYELEGFLYSVARNLWINKAKREQRKLPLLEGMEWASPDTLSILSKERENIVNETFGKIGDRCKQLLTLVIYFDHSMKELCEKMGFPNENAAKTQHYKCKQRLIELMGHNQEFKNLLKNAD